MMKTPCELDHLDFDRRILQITHDLFQSDPYESKKIDEAYRNLAILICDLMQMRERMFIGLIAEKVMSDSGRDAIYVSGYANINDEAALQLIEDFSTNLQANPSEGFTPVFGGPVGPAKKKEGDDDKTDS